MLSSWHYVLGFQISAGFPLGMKEHCSLWLKKHDWLCRRFAGYLWSGYQLKSLILWDIFLRHRQKKGDIFSTSLVCFFKTWQLDKNSFPPGICLQSFVIFIFFPFFVVIHFWVSAAVPSLISIVCLTLLKERRQHVGTNVSMVSWL